MSYLYAILESEARLAGISLGLDPLVGILHADQQARDNLVYDLVEPVRPQVDLRREWFLELATGQCRLMNSLVSRLSETAPIWARLVAPIAESVTQALWRSGKKASNNEASIPTRLTQRRRSEGRGNQFVVKATRVLQRERICELCGAEHSKGRYCKSCGIELAREHMANVALIGHSTPKTPAAKARISNRLSNHAVANTWWSPSSLTPWLNQEFYVEKIQPKLRTLKVREIAQAMQVSQPYAAFIRSGRRLAHPRHWQELARLAGVFADTEPEPGPQNKANQ